MAIILIKLCNSRAMLSMYDLQKYEFLVDIMINFFYFVSSSYGIEILWSFTLVIRLINPDPISLYFFTVTYWSWRRLMFIGYLTWQAVALGLVNILHLFYNIAFFFICVACYFVCIFWCVTLHVNTKIEDIISYLKIL